MLVQTLAITLLVMLQVEELQSSVAPACNSVPHHLQGNWTNSFNGAKLTIKLRSYIIRGNLPVNTRGPFKLTNTDIPLDTLKCRQKSVLFTALLGTKILPGHNTSAIYQCIEMIPTSIPHVVSVKAVIQEIRMFQLSQLDCSTPKSNGRRQYFEFAFSRVALTPALYWHGCVDKKEISTKLKVSSNFLTPVICARTCLAYELLFMYFVKSTCFCDSIPSRSIPSYENSLKSGNVTLPTSKRSCESSAEGKTKYRSYYIVLKNLPRLAHFYVGCYIIEDSPSYKQINHPFLCVQFCISERLLYAQYTSNRCVCSNSYGHSGISDSKCVKNCRQCYSTSSGSVYSLSSTLTLVTSCPAAPLFFLGKWYIPFKRGSTLRFYNNAYHSFSDRMEDNTNFFRMKGMYVQFQAVTCPTKLTAKVTAVIWCKDSLSLVRQCFDLYLAKDKYHMIASIREEYDTLDSYQVRSNCRQPSTIDVTDLILTRKPQFKDVAFGMPESPPRKDIPFVSVTPLGCAEEDILSLYINSQTFMSPAMTIDDCARVCFVQSMNVFSVFGKYYCHCGTRPFLPQFLGLLQRCPFEVSSTQKRCGDHCMKISVYRSATRGNFGYSKKGANYLSCVKKFSGKNTTTGGNDKSSATIDWCVSWCRQKNFSFAGLQHGKTCLCNNTYMKASSGKRTPCYAPCNAGWGSFCGGPDGDVAVYQVKTSKPVTTDLHKYMNLDLAAHIPAETICEIHDIKEKVTTKTRNVTAKQLQQQSWMLKQSKPLKGTSHRLRRALINPEDENESINKEPETVDQTVYQTNGNNYRMMPSNVTRDIFKLSEEQEGILWKFEVFEPKGNVDGIYQVMLKRGVSIAIDCLPENSVVRMRDATVSWWRGESKPITDGRFVLLETGALEIKDAEPADTGLYTCDLKGVNIITNEADDVQYQHLVTIYAVPELYFKLKFQYRVQHCDTAVEAYVVDRLRIAVCDRVDCGIRSITGKCIKHNTVIQMKALAFPPSKFYEPHCSTQCIAHAIIRAINKEIEKVRKFIQQDINKKDPLLKYRGFSDSMLLSLECEGGFYKSDSCLCLPCLPGTYAREKDNKCKLCPMGFYQSGYAMDKCVACPEYTDTTELGAKHHEDCKKAAVITIPLEQKHLVVGAALICVAVVLCVLFGCCCAFIMCRKSKKSKGKPTSQVIDDSVTGKLSGDETAADANESKPLPDIETAADSSKIEPLSDNETAVDSSKIEPLSDNETAIDSSKIEPLSDNETGVDSSKIEPLSEADSSKLEESSDSSKLEESSDSSKLEESSDSSKLEESSDSSKLEESSDSSKLEESSDSSKLEESSDSSELEESSDDESKLETSSADETKLEKSSDDGTKLEGSTDDETKLEESLDDETKLEESLGDETKLEESLDDETKLEESLDDETKQEESLDDETKPEESSDDETKLEESSDDETKKNTNRSARAKSSGSVTSVNSASEVSDLELSPKTDDDTTFEESCTMSEGQTLDSQVSEDEDSVILPSERKRKRLKHNTVVDYHRPRSIITPEPREHRSSEDTDHAPKNNSNQGTRQGSFVNGMPLRSRQSNALDKHGLCLEYVSNGLYPTSRRQDMTDSWENGYESETRYKRAASVSGSSAALHLTGLQLRGNERLYYESSIPTFSELPNDQTSVTDAMSMHKHHFSRLPANSLSTESVSAMHSVDANRRLHTSPPSQWYDASDEERSWSPSGMSLSEGQLSGVVPSYKRRQTAKFAIPGRAAYIRNVSTSDVTMAGRKRIEKRLHDRSQSSSSLSNSTVIRNAAVGACVQRQYAATQGRPMDAHLQYNNSAIPEKRSSDLTFCRQNDHTWMPIDETHLGGSKYETMPADSSLMSFESVPYNWRDQPSAYKSASLESTARVNNPDLRNEDTFCSEGRPLGRTRNFVYDRADIPWEIHRSNSASNHYNATSRNSTEWSRYDRRDDKESTVKSVPVRQFDNRLSSQYNKNNNKRPATNTEPRRIRSQNAGCPLHTNQAKYSRAAQPGAKMWSSSWHDMVENNQQADTGCQIPTKPGQKYYGGESLRPETCVPRVSTFPDHFTGNSFPGSCPDLGYTVSSNFDTTRKRAPSVARSFNLKQKPSYDCSDQLCFKQPVTRNANFHFPVQQRSQTTVCHAGDILENPRMNKSNKKYETGTKPDRHFLQKGIPDTNRGKSYFSGEDHSSNTDNLSLTTGSFIPLKASPGLWNCTPGGDNRKRRSTSKAESLLKASYVRLPTSDTPLDLSSQLQESYNVTSETIHGQNETSVDIEVSLASSASGMMEHRYDVLPLQENKDPHNKIDISLAASKENRKSDIIPETQKLCGKRYSLSDKSLAAILHSQSDEGISKPNLTSTSIDVPTIHGTPVKERDMPPEDHEGKHEDIDLLLSFDDSTCCNTHRHGGSDGDTLASGNSSETLKLDDWDTTVKVVEETSQKSCQSAPFALENISPAGEGRTFDSATKYLPQWDENSGAHCLGSPSWITHYAEELKSIMSSASSDLLFLDEEVENYNKKDVDEGYPVETGQRGGFIIDLNLDNEARTEERLLEEFSMASTTTINGTNNNNINNSASGGNDAPQGDKSGQGRHNAGGESRSSSDESVYYSCESHFDVIRLDNNSQDGSGELQVTVMEATGNGEELEGLSQSPSIPDAASHCHPCVRTMDDAAVLIHPNKSLSAEDSRPSGKYYTMFVPESTHSSPEMSFVFDCDTLPDDTLIASHTGADTDEHEEQSSASIFGRHRMSLETAPVNPGMTTHRTPWNLQSETIGEPARQTQAPDDHYFRGTKLENMLFSKIASVNPAQLACYGMSIPLVEHSVDWQQHEHGECSLKTADSLASGISPGVPIHCDLSEEFLPSKQQIQENLFDDVTSCLFKPLAPSTETSVKQGQVKKPIPQVPARSSRNPRCFTENDQRVARESNIKSPPEQNRRHREGALTPTNMTSSELRRGRNEPYLRRAMRTPESFGDGVWQQGNAAQASTHIPHHLPLFSSPLHWQNPSPQVVKQCPVVVSKSPQIRTVSPRQSYLPWSGSDAFREQQVPSAKATYLSLPRSIHDTLQKSQVSPSSSTSSFCPWSVRDMECHSPMLSETTDVSRTLSSHSSLRSCELTENLDSPVPTNNPFLRTQYSSTDCSPRFPQEHATDNGDWVALTLSSDSESESPSKR